MSASSSFLTSTLPYAGSIAGGIETISNLGRSTNFYATKAGKRWKAENRQQMEWERDNLHNRRIQDTVNDAKAAGLHPLAALGIAPASGGSSGVPLIPGQNNTGSSISTGIERALDAKRSVASDKHATTLQGMQLQEQQLRNDWLAQQIRASKVKDIATVANTNQDALTLKALVTQGNPHKGETLYKKADYSPHTGTQHGYNLFGGMTIKQPPGKLTVEGSEDSMGELGGLIYSPFSILQDIGYTLDKKFGWGRNFDKPKNWKKGYNPDHDISP